MPFWARRLALALSISIVGCGEKSAPKPEGDPGQEDEPRGCATDATAQPFSQGMSQVGMNGFEVAIAPDPPVPTVGDWSTWKLTVTDTNSGQPVPDGTPLSVDAVMTHSDIPSHGSPKRAAIEDTGPGLYQAYPVLFNMTGHWQVSVKVGTLDTVRFEVCVE